VDTKQFVPPVGDLLTVPEASAYFKVSIATIRAWVLQKRIPYSKVGGKLLRFRRVDLEKMLAARTVPAKLPAKG
jgi:excisionase family DNA binding protein